MQKEGPWELPRDHFFFLVLAHLVTTAVVTWFWSHIFEHLRKILVISPIYNRPGGRRIIEGHGKNGTQIINHDLPFRFSCFFSWKWVYLQ